MSSPDIRWIQRFEIFKHAFLRLREASALAKDRDLSLMECLSHPALPDHVDRVGVVLYGGVTVPL